MRGYEYRCSLEMRLSRVYSPAGRVWSVCVSGHRRRVFPCLYCVEYNNNNNKCARSQLRIIVLFRTQNTQKLTEAKMYYLKLQSTV